MLVKLIGGRGEVRYEMGFQPTDELETELERKLLNRTAEVDREFLKTINELTEGLAAIPPCQTAEDLEPIRSLATHLYLQKQVFPVGSPAWVRSTMMYQKVAERVAEEIKRLNP